MKKLEGQSMKKNNVIILMIVALLLAGCAGLHEYNPNPFEISSEEDFKRDENGNVFVFIKEDGTKVYNPKIEGLRVSFQGSNNTVILWSNIPNCHSCQFTLKNDSKILLKEVSGLRLVNVSISHGNILSIGKNTQINGAFFAMDIEKNSHVSIGADCQIADKALFWPSDGHTIIDKSTNKAYNLAQPIVIGDHVWIGLNTVILKGVNIPNDCVIAAGSIINSAMKASSGMLIGGSPAKCLKENILWDSLPPFSYNQEITKRSNNEN